MSPQPLPVRPQSSELPLEYEMAVPDRRVGVLLDGDVITCANAEVAADLRRFLAGPLGGRQGEPQ